MTINENNSKITSKHLERKAIVYLRQSTQWQVHHNLESKRLQYALADQAKDLGWEEIEVIDCDLGASASIGACQRKGFDNIIAMVAKGEVGIVMSREVSRLSRTDKDWCHLLEVCQIFDTLISDEEQIYDLSLMGDQLVLGIKGTLSVVEIKAIKRRMLQGTEEKARRGELFTVVPAGYILDPSGLIAKDPNIRVQEAISMIFEKFRQLWSIRKTFFWFIEQEIQLPILSCSGKRRIEWKLPTISFIGDVLRSPFYAGAYTWGRVERYKVFEDGKVKIKHRTINKPERCRVFIADHHEGYIDWKTFKENEKIIAGNVTVKSNKENAPGSVRKGKGLLVGLLVCGYCGLRLFTHYSKDKAHCYVCAGNNKGRNNCLSFGGRKVDSRFSEEILKVLSPLGVEASLKAIEQLNCVNNEKRTVLKRQLQQLQYEAHRAFEQYDGVDPKHPLVAKQLEQRWNEKLKQVNKLELLLANMDQSIALTDAQRLRILQLGENFQQVWQSENTTFETKKKIIRTVVELLVATLDESGKKIRFVIHWKGGSHTQFEMNRPRSAVAQKNSSEAMEIIQKMGRRYGDGEIARVLNKLGLLTGKDNPWTAQRIMWIRHKYSISGQKNTKSDPEILSLNQAVEYSNTSKATIQQLVSSGVLKKDQIVPFAPWEIKRADLDSEPVRNILEKLRNTGKLLIEKGVDSNNCDLLF